MKYARTLFLVIVGTGLLYSCQRELSFETGVSSTVDTSGRTCQIASLVQANSASGFAEYAYNTIYTADHKVSTIALVDSTSNSTDNTFNISYSPGKIQLGANQYFVIGADGKVTEFHGYVFPEDSTSERFNVKYTYNTAGQLVKRIEEYDLLPGVTTFEMDYSYTGSNLTKAIVKALIGLTLTEFIDVTYEYETTKTIKNFISLEVVSPEIFYFQTAINAGITSVNPIKKATTLFKKYNNSQDSSVVSNFINYTYDTKNQVTSFQVTGSDFIVNNLYTGKKYTISYSCH